MNLPREVTIYSSKKTMSPVKAAGSHTIQVRLTSASSGGILLSHANDSSTSNGTQRCSVAEWLQHVFPCGACKPLRTDCTQGLGDRPHAEWEERRGRSEVTQCIHHSGSGSKGACY